MDEGDTGQGHSRKILLPGLPVEGPIHSPQEGWWGACQGLKGNAAWKMSWTLSVTWRKQGWVGDSSSLGQLQLW